MASISSDEEHKVKDLNLNACSSFYKCNVKSVLLSVTIGIYGYIVYDYKCDLAEWFYKI